MARQISYNDQQTAFASKQQSDYLSSMTANSSRQSSVESSAAVMAANRQNYETKRLSGCADLPVNTRHGTGSARNSLQRGGMGYEEPCSQNIKSCSPILPMKLSQV